jgi:uncharacterized protein (TIGR01244 family)
MMLSSSTLGIQDFHRLSERIGTAGQPTTAQIGALAQSGYEVVINLRPAVDSLYNERQLVEQQGLEYVHIPVDWEAPTETDVQRFFEAMQARAAKKVFVHCARNMRASACMYLYRVQVECVPPETAEADLYHVWIPNSTWQKLIDDMLSK